MKKLLLAMGAFAAVPVTLFILLLVYPRPDDKTPAWVFEGDSSVINYCDLPILDGSGLMARDVSQAHTPNCGWEKFPQPVLKYCTEPLAPGSEDLRGLWRQAGTVNNAHIERIEQCGNRVVVTSSGIIHDLTTDGELSGASNDVRPLKFGPFDLCIRTSATTQWIDGKLEFYAFGGPHVVTRYLRDDDLYWEYPGRGMTHMKRICNLPKTGSAI